IQRSDLNAIEEAKAYYKLMELSGLSQDQVAAKVGKNRSTVANAIRLLKLPEDMQGALVQGKISAGHARAILSVADATDQQILFGKIMGQGMSVRQAEEAAAALNGDSKPKKDPPAAKPDRRDPDFANLEQQFIDVLGTKVVLKGSPERGSISIDYFSRADLNRLYEIFTGNKA
ncbi:MAG: ParB/RepB/Spo0J family partition protein, partial [Treponemataceae bacterium]|nr:ParB/RepB/Spo0J family partition protein [Treponemataceae bacterium]